jgi:heptosyltransferase-2
MKVLISPMYGIGDTLLITPAIKVLKKSRPDIQLTCLTFQKPAYDILFNNPYIDQLEFFPFLKKSKIEGLIYILKNYTGKFDVTLNFYPTNRLEYNLFAFFTFSKERLGHSYIKKNFSQLNFLKNKKIKESYHLHCVEENIKLLEFLDIHCEDIPAMEIYLTEKEMEEGRKYLDSLSVKRIKIGIHTGSSNFKNHYHRRWPKEKFLELINELKDFDFILFGTEEEKEENLFILNNSIHNNVKLVENKTIREVAAIIKNLSLFLSNDSGLMHLASTVGIPVVAIFGPTNPNWVRPWKVKHKVVRLDLSCSPCFYYSPKPLYCKIKEKFKCIREIEVEMVKKAICELLEM